MQGHDVSPSVFSSLALQQTELTVTTTTRQHENPATGKSRICLLLGMIGIYRIQQGDEASRPEDELAVDLDWLALHLS